MSDEKIMDDYIRECWNQDSDTWTQEEKAAMYGTIHFYLYQLQKEIEEATQPLLDKLDKIKNTKNTGIKHLIIFRSELLPRKKKQRLWNEIMAVTGASKEEMELLDANAKEIAANTNLTYEEALEGFKVMALCGYKAKDLQDYKDKKSVFKAMGFDW